MSKQVAREIFQHTLRAVDVGAATAAQIHIGSDALTVGDVSVPLQHIDEVQIIAVGKAAVPMYRAAEGALRSASLYTQTIVVAPEEFRETVRGQFFAGGHPLPNAESFAAAHAALKLLGTATERTAVLFLISGGASAMMEAPLDAAMPLEAMQSMYSTLVSSGLEIGAMNAVRKHLSAVKGGRLAQAARRAAVQWSLLVSDVPDAADDVIGSGPSLADSSTTQDARNAAARAGLRVKLTQETPKPGDVCFERAYARVVLSSEHLATAAAQAARDAGYTPLIDNACDEHPYDDAADYLLRKAAMLPPKYCLISVGEVSVPLPEHAGRGGRNQHFALYCALELGRYKRRLTVLSAGSDGMDGNSGNAGAVADAMTVREAALQRVDTERMFHTFNAAAVFEVLDDAIKTGPTGNNLRDLRLVLVDD